MKNVARAAEMLHLRALGIVPADTLVKRISHAIGSNPKTVMASRLVELLPFNIAEVMEGTVAASVLVWSTKCKKLTGSSERGIDRSKGRWRSRTNAKL